MEKRMPEKKIPTRQDVETWGTGKGKTTAGFAKWFNAAHRTDYTGEQIKALGIWPTATKPAKAKRSTSVAVPSTTSGFRVSPEERAFLESFRLLSGERQEEIATEVENESKRAGLVARVDTLRAALAAAEEELGNVEPGTGLKRRAGR